MGAYEIRKVREINEEYNQRIREIYEDPEGFYTDKPERALCRVNAIISDASRQCREYDGEFEFEFDVRLTVKKLNKTVEDEKSKAVKDTVVWEKLIESDLESLVYGHPLKIIDPDFHPDSSWEYSDLNSGISKDLALHGYKFAKVLVSPSLQTVRVFGVARDRERAQVGYLAFKFIGAEWDNILSKITMNKLVSVWCHTEPEEEDANIPLSLKGVEILESDFTKFASGKTHFVTKGQLKGYEGKLLFAFVPVKGLSIDMLGSVFSQSDLAKLRSFDSLGSSDAECPNNYGEKLISFIDEIENGNLRNFKNAWVEKYKSEISWLTDTDDNSNEFVNPDDFVNIDEIDNHSYTFGLWSMDITYGCRGFRGSYTGLVENREILGTIAYLAKQYSPENANIENRFFLRPVKKCPVVEFASAFRKCVSALCDNRAINTLNDVRDSFESASELERNEFEEDGLTFFTSKGFLKISGYRYAYSHSCVLYRDGGKAPRLFDRLVKVAEERESKGLDDELLYASEPPYYIADIIEGRANSAGNASGCLKGMNVDGLSGVDFERVCQQLVEKMGFRTETTKTSGDGGVDIVAYNEAPLISGKYVIQCKRYAGNVGEPIIRDLYGVVMSERANKGILITTGGFTKQATQFSEEKQIELIDGGKLRQLMAEYGMDANDDIIENICDAIR